MSLCECEPPPARMRDESLFLLDYSGKACRGKGGGDEASARQYVVRRPRLLFGRIGEGVRVRGSERE